MTMLLEQQQSSAWEPTGRVINGVSIECRRIGTYHHADDSQVFEQLFECAAWFRRGVFPIGDYPVIEYRGYTPGQTRVSVVLTGGVITEASFVSMFCGNRVGRRDSGDDEIGKPFGYSFGVGSFAIPLLQNDVRYTFDCKMVVRQLGNYSDGRPIMRAYDPETNIPIGS